MMRRMLVIGRIAIWCLVVGAVGWQPVRPAAAANPVRPAVEEARIAALLGAVERSGAQFIRNGTEYSAQEALHHMEQKLWWAGSRVKTAEEFIEGIASRSSISGKPYLIRLPDGRQEEAAEWLRGKLAEIDLQR